VTGQPHPPWCSADEGCSAYTDDDDLQAYHRSPPVLVQRTSDESTLRLWLALDPADYVDGRYLQPPAVELEELLDREYATTGQWWRRGESPHLPMTFDLPDAAGTAAALITLLAAAALPGGTR
jgi:hypothetical protein